MGFRSQPAFRTVLWLAAVVGGCLAQNGSVVVLDEADFQRVPEAVRGQSLGGGNLASGRVAIAQGDGEVHHFDPKRDATEDLRRAVAVAEREGKNVLVEVGGDWCGFCKTLDEFFSTNADVTRLRSENFVYVKVNFSQENQNEIALSKYPLIRGFPHFFVLNGKGEMVRSQRVALLGTNVGYSPQRFKTFLSAFAPKR